MKKFAMPVLAVLTSLTLITACATNKYTSVTPGVTSFGEMRVTIGEGWLRVPSSAVPEERSSSRTLTHETLARDRLMLIPGVSAGESIFQGQYDSSPATLFGAAMNSEQMAAMVGQSMQQALWNGGATVTVMNARDHGFGGIGGFAFDLEINMSDGPDHKGAAGGFVHEGRLYLIVYSAESNEYVDGHIDDARILIDSATVRSKTIGGTGIL